MNETILDQLDTALGLSHLDVVTSTKCTSRDREAAQKYLAWKGYAGPSLEGHRKAQDGHPSLKLAEWTESNCAEWAQAE